MTAYMDKIMQLDAVHAWRADLRRHGTTLVMTNGCFDLLHPGHVDYLNRAADEGDALLVAANGDDSIRALKGPRRPIIPASGRALMLAALAAVDAVHVFATRDCVALIEQVQPDVYVKGGDYDLDSINQGEREVLERLACRIAFVPFLPGYSTSSICARLRATE